MRHFLSVRVVEPSNFLSAPAPASTQKTKTTFEKLYVVLCPMLQYGAAQKWLCFPTLALYMHYTYIQYIFIFLIQTRYLQTMVGDEIS
jgi:hypothetical protein